MPLFKAIGKLVDAAFILSGFTLPIAVYVLLTATSRDPELIMRMWLEVGFWAGAFIVVALLKFMSCLEIRKKATEPACEGMHVQPPIRYL